LPNLGAARFYLATLPQKLGLPGGCQEAGLPNIIIPGKVCANFKTFSVLFHFISDFSPQSQNVLKKLKKIHLLFQ
jgi:hypothetical protein